MPKPAGNRRIVGLALLASAAVMFVFAILLGTGVIPVSDQSRSIIAVALSAAAVLDGLIGLRFLSSSTE